LFFITKSPQELPLKYFGILLRNETVLSVIFRLTIDAELAAQARNFDHRRKSSISSLVEKGLQNLTKDSDIQGKNFADKCMAKQKLAL
jgi:hypothetical protein